jgi:peroxiredoxin
MAIKVGVHAPHVTLIDTERSPVELPKHHEVTVLAFFPAAFTGVCTKEMCTFRDSLSAFEEVKAKVYGISVDSPFALAEFKKQQKLNFSLLADFKHEAIKAYDIVYPNLANIGFTAATRSVFVVGKDGNVAWTWVAESPPQEPNYDDVKRAVAAAAK